MIICNFATELNNNLQQKESCSLQLIHIGGGALRLQTVVSHSLVYISELFFRILQRRLVVLAASLLSCLRQIETIVKTTIKNKIEYENISG
jgi:hypothetical protein